MYFTSIILFESIMFLIVITCNILHKLNILSCFTTFFTGWKLFENNNKEYWYGFIPFYNMYEMCEIAFGENKGWYCIGLFLPITSWFMYPIYCNELRKKYKYEPLFTIGLIFLPFVFLPILIFDNEENIEEIRKKSDNHISKMANWIHEDTDETENTTNYQSEKIVKDIDIEKIQEKINQEKENTEYSSEW